MISETFNNLNHSSFFGAISLLKGETMQELSDEELLQKLQDLEQKISSLNAKQMAVKIL